jgi:hypothetical protein
LSSQKTKNKKKRQERQEKKRKEKRRKKGENVSGAGDHTPYGMLLQMIKFPRHQIIKYFVHTEIFQFSERILSKTKFNG